MRIFGLLSLLAAAPQQVINIPANLTQPIVVTIPTGYKGTVVSGGKPQGEVTGGSPVKPIYTPSTIPPVRQYSAPLPEQPRTPINSIPVQPIPVQSTQIKNIPSDQRSNQAVKPTAQLQPKTQPVQQYTQKTTISVAPPFDFTKWSLETPKDSALGAMGFITSASLQQYTSQYFHPDSAGSAILTATVDGFPPAGEDFVRCTLKQNTQWGIGQAHFLYVQMSIESMTTKSKKMMIVQLKSSENDFAFAVAYDTGNLLLVVRPPGTNGASDNVVELGQVKTGVPFTISAEVNAGGLLGVAYNGNTIYTASSTQVLTGKAYFFKTGAHLQTNMKSGETDINSSGIVRILNANTDI